MKKTIFNGQQPMIYRGMLLAALGCFLLAGIFAFGLIGYLMMALLFFALGLFLLLLWQCLRWKAQGKQIGTVLFRTAWALLACSILGVGLVEIPIIRAAKTDDVASDYLIVLGAGVFGTVPSRSMTDRVQAAISYLEKYQNCVAIVTGGMGPGEDITEAEAMYGLLVEAGISPSRILLEQKASNTEENLRYSLEMIKEREGTTDVPIAVVSSEYHLYRAKYLAKLQGATVFGVAAPTSMPLLKFNYFLREAFAVLKLWIFH